MEERILIVNLDGMFSALPTIEEYNDNIYVTTDKIVGRVKVHFDELKAIFDNKSHIRVLLPVLPAPIKGENLLYISVVKGCLIRV